MLKKIKAFAGKVAARFKHSANTVETAVSLRAHAALDGTKAEAYVDTGVKILIAVVVGALLLALLYALFNDTIMPSVTERVEEIFNYAG